jgi:HEAT repeat protein
MKTLLFVGLTVLAAGCGKGHNEDYSVPGLIKQLKDPDASMRYSAARGLGKYGAEARSAVPALIEALKDADSSVRLGVAYGLAGIGPAATEAVPALKEALKDKDPKVREAAAYALKKIQGKK